MNLNWEKTFGQISQNLFNTPDKFKRQQKLLKLLN